MGLVRETGEPDDLGLPERHLPPTLHPARDEEGSGAPHQRVTAAAIAAGSGAIGSSDWWQRLISRRLLAV